MVMGLDLKDPHGIRELHAMFLDIGRSLPRVPLVIHMHQLYAQEVCSSRDPSRNWGSGEAEEAYNILI